MARAESVQREGVRPPEFLALMCLLNSLRLPYAFGPTSELLPLCTMPRCDAGKEACSRAYGASHARADDSQVRFIGFWPEARPAAEHRAE